MSDLPHFEERAVPRCLKPENLSNIPFIQLHYFADASETDYVAASYLCLLDESDLTHCVFLIEKSPVAPLKSLTILTLELSAHSQYNVLEGLYYRHTVYSK